MVAVCRMAPQAALLEQSLAVGHRHPADSTTQGCGMSRGGLKSCSTPEDPIRW